MNARPQIEAPESSSEVARLAAIGRIAAAKGWGRKLSRMAISRLSFSANSGRPPV